MKLILGFLAALILFSCGNNEENDPKKVEWNSENYDEQESGSRRTVANQTLSGAS